MESAEEKALLSTLERFKFDIKLKEEQKNIIFNILKKKDVFALLPTGFGKSMTYILVPLIADELMGGAPRHTALVISPLKALMRDQVEFLEQHNVSAVALMDDTKNQDVMDKHYSVIYASPEAAIHQRWRKVLRDNLKPKVCVLVFDEAHCISSWGLDFRPAYRQVCSLQSIINTSTLVLTATATRKIQEDIYETLGFQTESTKVIAVLPD
ncbi:probable ATP-dependent DNA helicase RecQ, partial [Saccostrea cucullata]|uniref:probable ATP-dependent DNA helicase RecQ n=1 Tax=Saccostrea cuccullata TaxID=36930 RepID=UPI002ED6733A